MESQLGGLENIEDIMIDLLDAIGKGFAVSEIMWGYDEGHVVVEDIRSRHQKRFFWDSLDDSFKVRTEAAPEGILLPDSKLSYTDTKPEAVTVESWRPSCRGVDVPLQEL